MPTPLSQNIVYVFAYAIVNVYEKFRSFPFLILCEYNSVSNLHMAEPT